MNYRTRISRSFLTTLLAACAGALVTATVIYLTPLKWITVIEPTFNDVDPAVFYADYKVHPDHYLFIDVRTANEYRMAHAVGSINIPLIDLYDVHDSLPKHGKEIVLICTAGRSSGIAYMYLQHYGFFNIERVAGGLINWVFEGLPVEGAAVGTWNASDHSKQSQGMSTTTLAGVVEANACPRS